MVIADDALPKQTQIPASNFLDSICSLINESYGVVGSPLLTAVQAATDIDDLRARIEALAGTATGAHRKYEHTLRHLSHALQWAYDLGVIDNTVIAAFTTINTVDAATDVLYECVRRFNSTDYDNDFYGRWNPYVSVP